MISRGQNFKQIPLDIVGSSSFGRYPKISNQRTYNMFESDNFLVPYPGYQVAINQLGLGSQGRGLHTSTKLGKMVGVFDENVYLIDIFFDQNDQMTFDSSVVQIGSLNTNIGVVYIAENNKPQIAISDGVSIYIYDPQLTPKFQQVGGLNFVPGFIDFHDTYFLCAASQDNTYAPAANNTWRLSAQNDGSTGHWPSVAQNVGLLQTKPDNTQAVVRFPSKGNMIIVMGEIVTEFWFDTGAQLFPYQRNNQMTIDYGCVSPATIASTDELVVWLASNEKSGPIIMFTNGGMPEKITTDGIDYLFSQLSNPADSRAFLIRQDGHLIYHINFYTDNLSLFYDFNTKKFYHASDQNLNYFIGHSVSFFNNQYYFVSKNTGNLYAFDTIFTTYQDTDKLNNTITNEIPRIRTCKNIRLPTQEYFIVNDIGFTIETGETNYQVQNTGVTNTTPAVDLSVSYDGGASFSSDFRYELNPIGLRRNKLSWWQGGLANDFTCQFKFWGIGRVVATDGVVNIRQ